MAPRKIRESLASLLPHAASSGWPAPLWSTLRMAPLVAVPVALVVLGIDALDLDEVRYTAAPPADDDAPSWVVARTDGTLAGGCQLTAQVLDVRDSLGEGDAVDASLRLVRATAAGPADVWSATTNERGAHRFANLVPGTYHLAAFDGDRAPVAAPTFVCRGAGERAFARLELSDAEHALTGIVTSSDRRPVAGAEIAFEQEHGDRSGLAGVLRIPVAPDGAFSVKLAPGRYLAQITAPHHAPQVRKLIVDAANAKGATLTARLVPAPHVEGVLVDEAGTPIADGLVALGGALDPKAKPVRVRTDAQGHFSVPVQLGQYVELTARRGALVANGSVGEIRAPLGVMGVTLVARLGRTVSGQVTRTDGNPYAYGEVRFRVRELGLTGTERADGAGNFLLEGMPRDADVEVWAEGNATGAWGAAVASPGNDQLALVYVAPAY